MADTSRHSACRRDIDAAWGASMDACLRDHGDRTHDSHAVVWAAGSHPYRCLPPTRTGPAAAVWMPMPRGAWRASPWRVRVGWMSGWLSHPTWVYLGLRRRPRARQPTYGGGISQRGPGSLPSWCRWRTAWVSGWHVRFRWRPHAYRRCAHARVVLLRGSAVRAGARTSVGDVNSGGFASG